MEVRRKVSVPVAGAHSLGNLIDQYASSHLYPSDDIHLVSLGFLIHIMGIIIIELGELSETIYIKHVSQCLALNKH